MPIVLSYGDVQALGTLAYQAGYQPGRAQAAAIRSQQNNAMLAQMDKMDLAVQQQKQDNANAQLDRQNQLAIAQLQAQVNSARIASSEKSDKAQLAAAVADREDKQAFSLTQAADEHKRELETIAWKQAVEDTSKKGGSAALGIPDKKKVGEEMQQFGHLIPFQADQGVTPAGAARMRDDAMKVAESLTSLPNSEIAKVLAAQPNSPWKPYLQAIIQSRGGAAAAQPAATGAEPTAKDRALSKGQGLGEAGRLEALSDQELIQMASDPALLQTFLMQPASR